MESKPKERIIVGKRDMSMRLGKGKGDGPTGSDVKYGEGGLINGTVIGEVGGGGKGPGEASLGAEEKSLYVYGKKELRMHKVWAEEGSSEKVLQTL